MIIEEIERDDVILRIHAVAEVTLGTMDIYQQYKIKAIAVNLLDILLEKSFWKAEDFMERVEKDIPSYDYRAFNLLEDAKILLVKRGMIGIIYMFNKSWRLVK